MDYSAYGGKARSGVGERFDVVYHLYSTSKGGGALPLHVRVPENETVPSATSVYPGANLQEREVYDLLRHQVRRTSEPAPRAHVGGL